MISCKISGFWFTCPSSPQNFSRTITFHPAVKSHCRMDTPLLSPPATSFPEFDALPTPGIPDSGQKKAAGLPSCVFVICSSKCCGQRDGQRPKIAQTTSHPLFSSLRTSKNTQPHVPRVLCDIIKAEKRASSWKYIIIARCFSLVHPQQWLLCTAMSP